MPLGRIAGSRARPRTLVVVLLTTATMLLEIVAGSIFGSMALLADGLHMASHAVALAIAVFAYVYARRHAHDERFSFGTGKVNSLAGFTGAVLLALFAVVMVWESVHRLITPIAIAFDQALVVATIGLLVNGLSVVILGHDSPFDDAHDHSESHPHEHDGGRDEGDSEGAGIAHVHGHAPDHDLHHHHAHDHNLRSAYLHVLADALTSFLAIAALMAGKYFGQAWLDPAMGVLGAVLVRAGPWVSCGQQVVCCWIIRDRLRRVPQYKLHGRRKERRSRTCICGWSVRARTACWPRSKPKQLMCRMITGV